MWIRTIGNVLLGGLMAFVFARVLGAFSIVWWISVIVFAIGINMVSWQGE